MVVTERESGLEGVGSVPWGIHLCHFYRTAAEMTEAAPPFLKAGLEQGDGCLWAVSAPLEVNRAKAALAGMVADIDGYLASGQLEIIDFTGWFQTATEANAATAVAGLIERYDRVSTRGFSGFRLVGNVPVLTPEAWRGMSAREALLDAATRGRRMMVVCSYSLDGLPSADFASVVASHPLALLPGNGHWSLLESADHHHYWEDALVASRDELRMRVAERTAQLEALNKKLKSMAFEVTQAEENERRRISVALHDHSNQTLAACILKMATLARRLSDWQSTRALQEIGELLQQFVRETRMLVFEMNPPLLYSQGLEAALRELVRQTGEENGITAVFNDDGQPKRISGDVAIMVYQSVRELLVNVVKHARAERVAVAVSLLDGKVQVTVEDDGRGFDTGALSSEGSGGGFGLFSIRQRFGSIGGRMIVASDGRGTRILLAVPESGD